MPSSPIQLSARPEGQPSPKSDLPAAVSAPVDRIDAAIERLLRELPLPTSLLDAMCYSALGPGKRARPLLAWHSYYALAGSSAAAEPVLPACVAIELVHAFSLVHDDLPGMDNDDLRRGRPTLHRHTSEAMAILAGDCLLTSAFQILAERVESAPLRARLTHELSLGTNAMIAGQVYDSLGGFPAGLTDLQRLELVHKNKTGMLIRAACRMGALCALDGHPGAGRLDPLGAITHYADTIGLMFQIVDDLLDVTQTTAHLGKKAGKDADAGKLTYPGVLGVDKSREQVRHLHEQSLAALELLGEPAEPLRQLSTYLAVRTR